MSHTLTNPNVRVIDLAVLRRNMRLLRSILNPGVRQMVILRADAYGHGLVQAARAAAEAQADMIGVAIADEGVQLRQAGVTLPVLILAPARGECAEAAVRCGLTCTVCSPDAVKELETIAARSENTVDVHLKLDTGMSRIGCRTAADMQAVQDALAKAPHVRLTGVFTHFADADGADESFTRGQLERFLAMTAQLPRAVIRHCANSAAALRLPETQLDMVRHGVALYGYPPVETPLPLAPAMRWETIVTHVKDVGPGDAVSYGCTFRAAQPMRIATIACGYGDGYHRAAGSRAHVLINGQIAPVVGRICMDQMMADVTHIPGVVPGTQTVLMGQAGGHTITADDLAEWAGTISYEILLCATQRVRRIWTDTDKTESSSLLMKGNDQ